LHTHPDILLRRAAPPPARAMAGDAPAAPGGGAEQARATPVATVITIMANLVGAGLLSLPYTFRRSGLLVGALAMLVMAVLNTFSMVVIARCCELSGAFSYKDMAKAALGPVGGTVVTAVMAVYTLGSCVSFSVLLGDFLPALVCEDGCNTPAQQLFGQREVTMVMAGVLVLYPLCLPRQLNALKYTSTLSAVCIVYTAIMIAARAISSGPAGRAPAEDVHLFNGVVGLFISAPILAVSLTAHYNSARFYAELSNRSLARFTGIVSVAFVVVVALYQATAVGGYLLFGSATKGDVLQNFAGECSTGAGAGKEGASNMALLSIVGPVH
jgi:amino acid permease